jgi:hypothetical protein
MEKRALLRIRRVLELTGVLVWERFIPNPGSTFKLIPDPDLTIPFIPDPDPAEILA